MRSTSVEAFGGGSAPARGVRELEPGLRARGPELLEVLESWVRMAAREGKG